MKLLYDVNEKPAFGRNLLFAVQQLLAIIAATVLVPVLADATGAHLSQAAALIGAGFGTITYLLFTKFKSPVFLGSSFAFISPLVTAVAFGYLGIVLGALFAGLVYVVIAIIIKFVGSDWIDKLMPPVIIGPTVALIGFDLAGSAMNNLMNIAGGEAGYNLLAVLVGLVTFAIVILASVKGTKTMKMFPFVLGVLGGYVLASVFTVIGIAADVPYLQLIDFSVFKKVADFSNWVPNLTFVGMFKENPNLTGSGVLSLFVAFAPVALVTFAEHVADHKNISSIIEKDLLKDPGLDKTLLGDGVGSIAGAFFGGCPNTTYGESVGCVAITGNASVWTIFTTAILCIVLAFFYPFIAFVQSIPSCIVGGICIALYGFISVSGLRMFKHVDLDNSKNLFVVAAILIPGIGKMRLTFGEVTISNIACGLILGILTNLILKPGKSIVTKEAVPADPNAVEEETMFGTVQVEKKEEKPADTTSADENK